MPLIVVILVALGIMVWRFVLAAPKRPDSVVLLSGRIEGDDWYRKSVNGGYEFVLVDAGTLVKKAVFAHARLAASLSSAATAKYTAVTLPFSTFQFVDNQSAITFTAAGSNWRFSL